MLEESEIRIAELKKDVYEFKRDIVVGAENMRTGKTMAEKMTRYMEEKLRQRDSMIEKSHRRRRRPIRDRRAALFGSRGSLSCVFSLGIVSLSGADTAFLRFFSSPQRAIS